MKTKRHFILDENFDYKIIKDLSNNELKDLSDDIKELIISRCSEFGGHLSSNLGITNITISLFKCFDVEKDKIIFDIGHNSYAYKILTGRPLKNLRQKNGTDGFQRIKESKFDVYDAGHSSTSISAALGFAKSRDLLKEKKSVIVNLEYVNKDVARRIIDVVSGAVHALDGHMQKVSNAIFLIAPFNYDIENEMVREEMRSKISVSWLRNGNNTVK